MFIEQPARWLRWLYPKAIWRMDSSERSIYLTFDDGPIPESTPFLLETLDKYGVKAMLSSGSKDCAIINVSSAEGIKPTANFSPYSGAKRAVISLTQTASMDYARHDITVNCICPGATDTEIYSTISPEQRELTQSMIPNGRFARPEEMAYPALFLASDLARYITGAVIPVDGAMSAGNYTEVPWND